jgi:putative transposase
MPSVVLALLAFLAEGFRSRRSLQLEILVLWHQLVVYQRSVARARIQPSDRLFWSWLVCLWSGWQDVLALVQPRTVVALAPEAVPGALEAIEPTQHARPACNSAGGPRADPDDVAEQSDLGRTTDRRRITEAGHRRGQSIVERYRVRPRQPPPPTWKAFLNNHVRDVAAMDFFVVPPVTFKALFVLGILVHKRRRIVHAYVTEYPTVEWTAQQVVDTFLWRNPYLERVIGSISRDMLDHIIVLNEPHLIILTTLNTKHFVSFPDLHIERPY